MASSVTFPAQSHDPPPTHPPASPPRPPHLPFRRISLPSFPNAADHRQSFVSVASFGSTPEEGRPAVPTLIRSVSNQPKARAFPHARPTRSVHNKRRDTVVDASLAEKRRKVVKEIFDTERTYVDGLDLIYTNFLMPLVASLDTPQPLLDRKELTSVFSNFIDIWNLHRSFFTSLSTLLPDMTDSSPPPPPLSPILISHFPYLSLYSPFVRAFPTILTSLSGLMASSPRFATFIRTQEADPRCRNLGLRHWLLTVVSRCPRYLLLLKDLIKCTDRSDPEYISLTAVHTLLSKITLSLDTSLHTQEQILSLLSLQRATPNLPFQLITPGRSLIRRGTLLQGQVERDAPDEREFLLFSDCLIWLSRVDNNRQDKDLGSGDNRFRRRKLRRGRSKSETELPGVTRSGTLDLGSDERWTFKGTANLVDVEVVVNPAGRRGREEDEEEKLRFDVLSPEFSFSLYAETEEERDEWIEAIRGAKSSLLVSLNMNPNSTLTSSEATTHVRRALQALPHAPDQDGGGGREQRGKVDHFVPAIWVPDSKSDSCMRCGARFGWRRRRHHCRLCGRCVCANCSGKTFYISDKSAKSTKPARACNACYDTVFPLVGSSSLGDEGTTNTSSQASTLGTLSQLPSWKSMPAFEPPSPASPPSARSNFAAAAASPSSLFSPPPSAFHEPRRRPRPQSQPVMAAPHLRLSLNASPPASANASEVQLNVAAAGSAVSLGSGPEEEVGEGEGEEYLPRRPDPKRFSVPALAVHTASVTARPSVLGEGMNRRFSLVLAGKGGGLRRPPPPTQEREEGQQGSPQEQAQGQQQPKEEGRQRRLERGLAVGKLSEILRRGPASRSSH